MNVIHFCWNHFKMNFVILVVIIVSGPWNAQTSPHPGPSPRPSPSPSPSPSPTPEQSLLPAPFPEPQLPRAAKALPAAVVPIVVAVASNPAVKNAVIHGSKLIGRYGGAVGRGLGNAAVAAGGAFAKGLTTAFQFSSKHLASLANKFRGVKSDTIANVVESTALVPVAAGSVLPIGLEVSGGPKKTKFWDKIGTAIGKTAELTAQASNVAVSVAGAVQVAQVSAIQAAQAQAAAQVSGTQSCSSSTSSVNTCPLGASPSNGGFSFGSNLKISWLDKSATCRENIINLADLRPSFAQSLSQFSLKANLNFKLHSHRMAVMNCGSQKGFPKITLAPNTPREVKPTKASSIPISSKKTLMWKGLTWFSPLVINTCILDSFLTHMVLRCKLDSTYIRRNFLISQNPGEAVLTEIVSQYRKLPFSASVQNQKLANQNWKQLWIKTFEPQFKNELAKGQTVDYKGAEFENVIEKLIPSCTTFESQSCKCKENNAEKVIVKRYYMKFLDLPELKKLSREGRQDHSDSISYPMTVGITRSQVKTCKTCLGDFKIDFYFVPTSTWFLYFMFTRMSTPFSVTQVPKTFVAHELFFYDKIVVFELGYITCSTTVALNGVTHQLSFQYFNQQFYYYDDLKGGELIWAPNPDLTIRTKQLKCGAVTYFRP